MPEISLTEFVDFALKSGTPQFTAVKEIKRAHEVGYHPTRDFYLKMRDGIVEMHRDNAPKSALDGLVRGTRDKNKQKLYPVLAEGYRKFLGRKAISWFEPPRCNWSFGGLVVRVNPELGLSFDGQDHIIKLYFKEDKLLKRGIEHVNYLILSALGSNAEGSSAGILDVRNGKLIDAGQLNPSLAPMLEAQALSFCHMYKGA